jgi:toxin ParE1/3/4
VVLRIIWSRNALADLKSIYDYIARDSKRYAQIQLERIQEGVRRAGEFPESGRIVPEFPNRGWREVLVGNYRAIYRVDRETGALTVLAVVHGRQLLRETMIGRD